MQEDVTADPPRLIGYNIPDALPLPPIPKTLPPPSPPPASSASTSRKKQTHAVSSSAATATLASNNAASASLKRKESSKSGDAGTSAGSANEDGQNQAQPKKQRMAAKSPTATSSETTKNDDPVTISGGLNSQLQTKGPSQEMKAKSDESSSTVSRSKKGKGKATESASDADVAPAEELSAIDSKTLSTTGSANGADKAEPARRSSAINAASKPNLLTNPSSTIVNKLDNGTSTPEHRRSASPTTATRKPNGVSNLGKDASRPRSASPNTTLRSVSNSSQLNAARQISANQTPTLDSSKASSASAAVSSQTVPSVSQNPILAPSQLKPQHVAVKSEVITLKGHTMPVQPCHWNPKVETLLATGSGDSTMRIWDVPMQSTGVPISSTVVCKHSSGQRRSDVTAVEWNKDGSLLASGSEDGIARIWTPSGDLHLVLSMHQRTIFCVKWNNTGSMLLTGSLDHSICLWDTGYGKVKQQWSTHADSILDLDWMTDDIFASCSMDKMINSEFYCKCTSWQEWSSGCTDVPIIPRYQFIKLVETRLSIASRGILMR